jgi:DNA-binding response OmpR family regulator
MPGIDGLTLLKRLRSSDPQLEVIILTGHPSVSDVRRGLQEGAFDYLVKPVPVDELLDRVRDARNRRELRKDGERQDEVDRILSDHPD